jgi:hypothetical protein
LFFSKDRRPQTADDAKAIYNADLKESLERDFRGQYVAIVSETRNHYVKSTFLESALAARKAEPNYVPFVIKIGHEASLPTRMQFLQMDQLPVCGATIALSTGWDRQFQSRLWRILPIHL